MSYEEDYEKARLLFRDVTMAPEAAPREAVERLVNALPMVAYLLLCFLGTVAIIGALCWWCWAVWPDILGFIIWP